MEPDVAELRDVFHDALLRLSRPSAAAFEALADLLEAELAEGLAELHDRITSVHQPALRALTHRTKGT